MKAKTSDIEEKDWVDSLFSRSEKSPETLIIVISSLFSIMPTTNKGIVLASFLSAFSLMNTDLSSKMEIFEQ